MRTLLERIRDYWPLLLVVAVILVFGLPLAAYLASVFLRKLLRRGSGPKQDEFAPPQPRSENESAFLAASTQSVIQRLREQEKKLERLHRLEKERLQQAERFSEAVTRNMPTGLLLVNANGLVSMANRAAESALGVGALNYRRYSEVLGVDSPLARLLAACLQEGRTFQREEVEHRTPAGDVRQLGVTVSPTYAPAPGAHPSAPQKPAGAICLLSDLTELTALQKQVRLQENMAALGEMSAGIAHEFKNALAIISGYAQMIGNEAPPGELAESAERILKETRALTHVVAEFLRFARPLQVSPETVELRPLVQQVVTEVGQALPHVSLCMEGDFAEVSGDDGLLRQVLLNLARNAAEAASESHPVGGPDSMGARVTVCGAVEENSGRRLQRISVIDNGSGIPPENLSKLFLPFFTTKPGGTGLGLAVVQKIALQHGGSVEARNHARGGAEFILWLPLPADPPQAVDSPTGGI